MNFPKEAQENFDLLKQKLEKMRSHNVFSKIENIEDLQKFMQWHIFAVWDFMSLAKRLQIELTCVTLPWVPSKHKEASRLINEIILGEESDVLPTGEIMSHFEMYLLAMKEIGAEPTEFNSFYEALQVHGVEKALEQEGIDPAIKNFVTSTINTSVNGKFAEVLGSFFFGREDSIPEMFGNLLKTWNIDEQVAPTFVYYLKRHIELDGDTHGPAVQKIMAEQLGDCSNGWGVLFNAAIEAADLRIALWDALEVELSKPKHNAA